MFCIVKRTYGGYFGHIVVLMSDYELLMIILTFGLVIIGILNLSGKMAGIRILRFPPSFFVRATEDSNPRPFGP